MASTDAATPTPPVIKRVIVIRHGEGHHQTDKVAEEGLGPVLTEKGAKQAREVQSKPSFAKALATATNPVFVASNVARAAETMTIAAPGRPIIIQPLARERFYNEFDWPSRADMLSQWLEKHGSKKVNFSVYQRELEQFDSNLGDPYDQYIRTLKTADGNGRICGHIRETRARAARLIEWMSKLDADTIFLTSHGGFLMYVDRMAHSTWLGGFWDFYTGRSFMGNCDVKEYRLISSPHEPPILRVSDVSDRTCCCL
jgi:broad specificity phosphatase PhoE